MAAAKRSKKGSSLVAATNEKAIVATYETDDFVVQVLQNDFEQTNGSAARFIFNSAAHLRTQHAGGLLFSLRLSSNKGEVDFGALIHFFVANNQAVSLQRASFGSIDWHGNVPDAGLIFLFSCTNEFALQRGWQSGEIRNFPQCYAPQLAERIRETLVGQGFGVSKNQVNYHILVSEEPFYRILGNANRRRLRKCQRAGFSFEQLHGCSAQQVYDFIAASRARQQYRMTLELPQMERLMRDFPDQVLIFCVKDRENIACLTLAVRVNEGILYNFCPADNLDYRTYSPSVMLTEGLYEFSQRSGIGVLDLGISVDADGNLKPTLVRFKENLGGVVSEKWTFKRDY